MHSSCRLQAVQAQVLGKLSQKAVLLPEEVTVFSADNCCLSYLAIIEHLQLSFQHPSGQLPLQAICSNANVAFA